LESALRLDHIDRRVDDSFGSDGDESGDQRYLHLSPSLGLSHRLTSSHSAYANYGHSFESPTLSALSANPSGGGGFKPELKPLQADHFELGLRGQNAGIDYQLALFHIDLKNELIPFELEQFIGRTFFRNAGTSVRDGLELAAQVKLSQAFSSSVSYSYSRFRFGESDLAVSEKQTPGVPQHNAFWQLSWQSESGWSAGFDLRHQGVLFADDLNMVEVESATIADLRVGYRRSNYSLYGGVRNLFGEKYFDNIRINAFGGRYYEAAPLGNCYAGVKVEL